jgi:hypothetical protein
MADVGWPGKLKIFISYSRADEAFAEELRLGLEDKGYAVEIDKHSIRQGEEWKARLGKLIAGADTVVFVLSPDSARSAVCHWEVEEADRQAKRIVPVLHRGLGELPKGRQPDGSPWPEGPAKAPERLSLINYPRFDGNRSFMQGLRGLVQALEDDVEWIDAHSRLATRARDWDDGGRPSNRLMSGPDIAAAKQLIEMRKPSAPPMLPVQLDFIQASEAHEAAQSSERERELEEKRRLAETALAQSRRVVQRTRIGLAVAVALMVVAGWFGYDSTRKAREIEVQKAQVETERVTAVKEAERAARSEKAAEATTRVALITQSGLLSEAARAIPDRPDGDTLLAMLLALEAMPDAASDDLGQVHRPAVSEAQVQLDRALRSVREQVFAQGGEVYAVAWSPDGRLLVTSSYDGTARVVEAATGKELARIAHDDGVQAVAWSPNGAAVGPALLTGSADRTARLWRVFLCCQWRKNEHVRATGFDFGLLAAPDERTQ